MALPTLPSYWHVRNRLAEQRMLRQRNHEAQFRETWDNHARYFHKSNVQTAKGAHWSSHRSYQDSMEAFNTAAEKEAKSARLKERRERLSELLKEERDTYEAELRGMSLDNYRRMESMKERADHLKEKKETERKQIAEVKLKEHFRRNNPDLRQIESEQHKQHVIGAWSDQVEEKEERIASARAEEKHIDDVMERQRLAALKKQREEEIKRMKAEKRQAGVLKEQVEELKDREREAEALKQEEAELLRQQWELEKMEAERKAFEEQRKKADLGRALSRQYKMQMRRKSQQVQEALELDRKILAALTEKEQEDRRLETERRERAQADAAWMKEVVEKQMRLEKEREEELDEMYRHEAERQWAKRDAEWERERLARERLMKEVLEERQDQLAAKMEALRQRQADVLRSREDLLRQLEVANRMARQEEEERERAVLERKQEVEGQITERRERQRTARERLEQELAEEKRAEQDYEEVLRQEAARLKLGGFEPKSYPRSRRSAWD
ncbi:trichoplein keratin filament-binding protein-like [Branchiostoma floridae]|uniref:Trichoplein keratin filament-binding protein n=1 Tax=Branchiostoma floridae TaxID=7739 RepID=C3XV29_BRAFL|nr:trichoplein keratin filament-binding protein-like [Branchiostoma floridae]|eukprot:XP_002611946.1 hypothetical protein BRAFLDRAFT_91830 [Branchiostoma floridae]